VLLDFPNEPSRTGDSPNLVSRVENVQFVIHCGLLEAACWKMKRIREATNPDTADHHQNPSAEM
jgi:hypothetical protein